MTLLCCPWACDGEDASVKKQQRKTKKGCVKTGDSITRLIYDAKSDAPIRRTTLATSVSD